MHDNEKAILDQFDSRMKYREYLEKCRNLNSYNGYFSGLEKVQIFDRDLCVDIRRKIDNSMFNLEINRAVVDKISEKLDAKLKSYFGCEYLPLWLRYYKNEPKEFTGSYSFKWHCDGGPSNHLKVLVYLNSSKQSGGNTLFLDGITTQEFKDIGYVFTNLDKRELDLRDLAEKYGIGLSEIRHDIEEGEGILFEPMSFLHKGIWPEHCPRYMVQLCFIPSPKPYKDIYEKLALPSMSNSWPNPLQFLEV